MSEVKNTPPQMGDKDFQQIADYANHIGAGMFGFEIEPPNDMIKKSIAETRKNPEACKRVAQFFVEAMNNIYKKSEAYPDYSVKITNIISKAVTHSLLKAGISEQDIINESGFIDDKQIANAIARNTLTEAVTEIEQAVHSLPPPAADFNISQELSALKLAASDPLVADAKTQALELSKNAGKFTQEIKEVQEKVYKWSKSASIAGYVLAGFGVVRTLQKTATDGAWKGLKDFWSNISLLVGAVLVGLTRGLKKAELGVEFNIKQKVS